MILIMYTCTGWGHALSRAHANTCICVPASGRALQGYEANAEQVQVVMLPDCSHWANQDRPELVNAHMRSFLLAALAPAPGGKTRSLPR